MSTVFAVYHLFSKFQRSKYITACNMLGNKKLTRSDLKKWAPTILSCDCVFSPIMFRSIVDVLDAKMQCEGQTFSISLKIFCFNGILSMTACSQREVVHVILYKLRNEQKNNI